ncbi:Cytokine-dependent hematopoietic cell linker [Halotydeus destructor]|nr:Cytokine-dependent hematopoietic cell linker [Halotydeus destructor]
MADIENYVEMGQFRKSPVPPVKRNEDDYEPVFPAKPVVKPKPQMMKPVPAPRPTVPTRMTKPAEVDEDRPVPPPRPPATVAPKPPRAAPIVVIPPSRKASLETDNIPVTKGRSPPATPPLPAHTQQRHQEAAEEDTYAPMEASMRRPGSGHSGTYDLLNPASRLSDSATPYADVQSTMSADKGAPIAAPKYCTFCKGQCFESLHQYPWYQEIEREHAHKLLLDHSKEGMFLVRPGKRAGLQSPYSLSLYHGRKPYHLNIRKRADLRFALGTEKDGENSFPSVPALVDYHMQKPILLTSNGLSEGQVLLDKYARAEDWAENLYTDVNY